MVLIAMGTSMQTSSPITNLLALVAKNGCLCDLSRHGCLVMKATGLLLWRLHASIDLGYPQLMPYHRHHGRHALWYAQQKMKFVDMVLMIERGAMSGNRKVKLCNPAKEGISAIEKRLTVMANCAGCLRTSNALRSEQFDQHN